MEAGRATWAGGGPGDPPQDGPGCRRRTDLDSRRLAAKAQYPPVPRLVGGSRLTKKGPGGDIWDGLCHPKRTQLESSLEHRKAKLMPKWQSLPWRARTPVCA